MNAPPEADVAARRGTRTALTELATAVACLIVGIVVMPCLIFLAGHLKLGDYARGGLFAFWRDFLAGLARGSAPFWFIALGPYVLLSLLRAGRRLLHKAPIG